MDREPLFSADLDPYAIAAGIAWYARFADGWMCCPRWENADLLSKCGIEVRMANHGDLRQQLLRSSLQ